MIEGWVVGGQGDGRWVMGDGWWGDEMMGDRRMGGRGMKAGKVFVA